MRIKQYGDAYCEQHRLPFKHLKVIHHIRYCRTAVMGGHQQQCNQCGFERNAYNSCGDRHCPKCRTLAKGRWLDACRSELLPTGHFHLVFTLPHDLNPMIHCNPKALLDNLFGSVNETLQAFAADPRWRLTGWHLEKKTMDRLCQGAICRTRAGTRRSGALHPPGGHLQPSAIIDG